MFAVSIFLCLFCRMSFNVMVCLKTTLAVALPFSRRNTTLPWKIA